MANFLKKYKGYEGVVEYDGEANILHGEVLHIHDVITFQADCVGDLEAAFHDSVDDYLEFCAQHNRKPEKPYTGKVSLRLPPELHKEIVGIAKSKQESVNSFIVEAVQAYAMKS